MQIIIAPAKKMNVDADSLPWQQLPAFLEPARQIYDTLLGMDRQQLQALWRCNDAIAAQSLARLRRFCLTEAQTPALLAYEGIQYQYMAPGVLDDAALAYLADHLRILSGLYGVLSPFDAVIPYRLEMQARLSVAGAPNLYRFWGDRLARRLADESDQLLNLASKEYSDAVLPHLPPGVRVMTCLFGEKKEGRILEKGTLCKMARGRMVRWLAVRRVEGFEALREFDEMGYRFSPEDSTGSRMVFLQDRPRG